MNKIQTQEQPEYHGSTIKPMSEESKRMRKIIKESDRRHYAAVAKRLGRKTFAKMSKQYDDDIVTK